MKILVTGAFGTVGRAVIDEANRLGHAVSVLDVDTPRNRRTASRLRSDVASVFLGDIRNPDLVDDSVAGQDAVIHLAAILPPLSEANPDLCRSVNVNGTANVVEASAKAGRSAVVVLVSSASVMGPTQDREPPIRPGDPVAPNDVYARSKVDAEALVLESGLHACVLRLAAVLPSDRPQSVRNAAAAFDLPLNARCEAVVDLDVAAACVHAAESLARESLAGYDRLGRDSGDDPASGRVFFVGGGKEGGWQMHVRDMYEAVFGTVGLPLPSEQCFTPDPNRFAIDWYDTDDSQRHFGFQNHTFAEYKESINRKFRAIRPAMTVARPVVMRYLESLSPYR